MPRSVVGGQDQSVGGEDEALSTHATVGSESRGDTTRVERDPQERMHGSQGRRPLTRALVRRAQLQQPAPDEPHPASTTDDILRWDDSQFRGLTPPPLPYESQPQLKKRGLQEIIEDNSPQEPDGMTREIEELLKFKQPHHQQQTEGSSAVASEQRRDNSDRSKERSLNSDHAAKRIKASSIKGDDGLS